MRARRTGIAAPTSPASASFSSAPAISGVPYPEIEDERDRLRSIRHTFRLIHLADIVAVTPGV